MNRIDTPSMKQRMGALITAGALAMTTMGAPLAAYAADPVSASAGVQTGTGETSVTVQLPRANEELGGSTDTKNPDNDHDELKLGDNIAFTVPTSINFVAKTNGDLLPPSAASTYIENESVFGIYASSMQVDVASDWNLVRSVASDNTDTKNIFDFTFGPAADQLNAMDYTSRTNVATPSAWEMTYAVNETGEHPSDRVELSVSGHIGRVSNGITEQAKLATLKTYVKQGKAPVSTGSGD